VALDSKWHNIAYIRIVKPSPFPLVPNMIAAHTSVKHSSWSALFANLCPDIVWERTSWLWPKWRQRTY